MVLAKSSAAGLRGDKKVMNGARPDRARNMAQMNVAATPSTFDFAFVDLGIPAQAEGEAGEFRAQQIAAVAATSPVILCANLFAAAMFTWAQWGHFPPILLMLWALPMGLLALYLLVRRWRYRRKGVAVASPRAIRSTETYACLLGFLWALFPALFYEGAPADLKTLIIGMTLASAGIGAFALSAVPSAAILFSLLVSGSLAMTGFGLGDRAGLAFGGMTLVYGSILVFMILASRQTVLRQLEDSQEINRQRDIISLLLNDFEQGTSDWLWETGLDGRLVYCSKRLAEVVGTSRERLRGASLLEAAGAVDGHAGWDDVQKFMQAHTPLVGLEVAAAKPQAQSYWRLTARPLLGRTGEFLGYRGVGHDITAERLAQNELIRAKQDAESASAAKSQFLAVMSHELKTPLNAIIGFSSLLAAPSDQPLPAQVQAEYAHMIHEGGLHLRALIEDILDISRIERGSMRMYEQEADAAELAEIAAKMCREPAEMNDVGIIATLIDNLEITGDITRIKQVIINLLTNAIKFSGRGSNVELAIEIGPLGEAIFVITDQGIGIAPEDTERVFEPFVQAEATSARRFGGLGLGLPIARRIARLHGGDVTLESISGQGTTARFTLPSERVSRLRLSSMRAVA